MSAPNDIVLFWYSASPYGRRVQWYLTLRNIAFAECKQPPILPRPDLDALGVSYRRSPVLALGRDIYVDSRLIVERLEERFPGSAAHPALSSPATAGVAALLQKLMVDAGGFQNAVRLIPPQAPMLQDPKFLKDRAQYAGGKSMSGGVIGWQEGVVHMRQIFELLESMFADGREWIAGTPQVSLADLEGIWPIDWLISDLHPPKEYFSAEKYPKVYAWRARFRTALDAARARTQPQVVTLRGAQAVQQVVNAAFTDEDLSVDPRDPTRLKAGTLVEFFPTDGGGFFHQDRGRLLKLTAREVAIAIAATSGEEIHLHAPRWQFRLRAMQADSRL